MKSVIPSEIRYLVPILALTIALAAETHAQLEPLAQDHVLRFGGNHLATAPADPSLNLGGAFTIETWLFLQMHSPYAFILGKPHDTRHDEPWMSYSVGLSGDGRRIEFVQTTGQPGSYRNVVAPQEVELGQWTHVAATLSDGQMRLFINGQEVGVAQSPGTPDNDTLPFGVGGGAQSDESVIGGFQGALRQVRVWNRALDAAELTEKAAEAPDGTTPGLIAYWPLDDGAGTTARDLGPSDLPLQFGYAAAEETVDPHWMATAALSGGPYFVVRSTPLPGWRENPNEVFFLDDPDPAKQVAFLTQLRWPPTVPGTELPLIAFRNDGSGNFTEATEDIVGENVRLVHPRDYAVADFTGDGRAEMFIADHGTDTHPFPGFPNLLLVRQPDGSVANEAPQRMETYGDFSHHAAVADVTGNGVADIYVANTWGSNDVKPLLYINDGSGDFTVDTDRLPSRVASRERVYMSSRFVDVNRNGRPDLVLGGHDGSGPGQGFLHDALLLNQADGYFVEASEDALPPRTGGHSWGTVAVSTGDFNANGWPDLLMATHNAFQEDGRYYTAIQLLLNNRDGTFSDASDRIPQPPTTPNGWVTWNKVADFNGDGWLDFLTIVNGEGVHLFLNTGDGHFENYTYLLPHQLFRAEVADVTGNGLPDIVGFTHDQLFVFENNAPFHVAAEPVPLIDPPVLTYPQDGGSLAPSDSLHWDRRERANSYEVQVAADASFSDVLFQRSAITTEVVPAPALQSGTSAFWRVRARNTRGVGDWSAPFMFTASGGVSIDQDGSSTPALVLEQPFPNPASHATTVTFSAPISADVRIEAFDLLGRRVETLRTGAYPGGGGEIVWDTSGYSAGVYVIRLTAQGGAPVSRAVWVAR